MGSLVIESKPRKMTSGNSWRIDVVGPDGRAKDEFKTAVKELEHHPAKAARRSLIDILTIIDQLRMQIKYVEHHEEEGELESWLFITQD
ncbi:MAG: hypothetical protein GY796_29370 [Chloroflexi bacterium]|nr:hypothetical protein [Chloroflexota bacterium]